MKKVIKDIFSKLMFNILKNYVNLCEKVKKLVTNLRDKTEYSIFKKFKTSIKSWINLKKSS